ncbi:hypothetical protein ACLOJK_034289 [Asimina triloba]
MKPCRSATSPCKKGKQGVCKPATCGCRAGRGRSLLPYREEGVVTGSCALCGSAMLAEDGEKKVGAAPRQ